MIGLPAAPAQGVTAARSCGDGPNHPGSRENVIADVRARGTSCRRARRVADAVRDGREPPFGFTCKRRSQEASARYTCRKAGARVRFTVIVF
jgi:hypothetical protein